MKRRPINPRLAKIHWSYDVAELAKLFGVCRGTVRDWNKRGLRPMEDGRRPALFLGAEVRRFLIAERERRKCPNPAGHFRCFKCRVPRMPHGNDADYRPRTDTWGMLEGICSVCGRMLYRAASLAKLEAIRGDLRIRFLNGGPRISTRSSPSLNPDSDDPAAAHAETLP